MAITAKKLVYIVEKGTIFSAEVTDGGLTITIENQARCSLSGRDCWITNGHFYIYEGAYPERQAYRRACPIPGQLNDEYITFDVADAQKEAFKQRSAIKTVSGEPIPAEGGDAMATPSRR